MKIYILLSTISGAEQRHKLRKDSTVKSKQTQQQVASSAVDFCARLQTAAVKLNLLVYKSSQKA